MKKRQTAVRKTEAYICTDGSLHLREEEAARHQDSIELQDLIWRLPLLYCEDRSVNVEHIKDWLRENKDTIQNIFRLM